MENSIPQPKAKSWLAQHAAKFPALLFWASLIIGYQWYASSNGFSPLEVVQRLLDFMTTGFWGPLVYIGLYIVRPLILFPSTVLTLAGGFVFGPLLGVLYTILASNSSSTVAFFVGGYFCGGGFKNEG